VGRYVPCSQSLRDSGFSNPICTAEGLATAT
jgi:hypothetical protein